MDNWFNYFLVQVKQFGIPLQMQYKLQKFIIANFGYFGVHFYIIIAVVVYFVKLK